ncbi:Phage tail fiber protein [Enterobacteriaceae bacterium bta3-1]|nr:Phage tail fiber protein [Enterobacteriaceae bacterium bta3-1]
MAQKYKAVLTKIGAAKIAAATAGGTKINLTQMAVGDGGGTLPTPDPAQTELIAEKHRAALNKVIVDPKHKNYLVAELVIPPEIGGFWMRELGLYDEVGALIAVSNMAESYKPLLSEGSGRAQTLRMVVIVSDMDTVNLLIDSSTVLATQEYVDDKLLEHEQSRRHPDATLKEKGFTQLSSATNSTSEALAATPKAVKAAYDKAIEADKKAQTADENAGKANNNANTRLEKNKNLSDLTDKPKARVSLELGTAATANVQTSQTDNTPNAVLKVGAFGLGGTVPRLPAAMGTNYDNIPTKLPTGFYTHQVPGGVFCHTVTLHQDGGGELSNRHFIIPSQPSEKIAVRWDTGTAFSYQYIYTDKNKPTAADVGALPSNGNAVSATKLATSRKIAGKAFNGTADITISADDVGALPSTGGTLNGNLTVKNQIQVGGVGTGVLNIGDSDSGLRSSVDGQVDLYANGRMYGYWNATTLGFAGRIIPTDYANFDTRYQAKGNYANGDTFYDTAENTGVRTRDKKFLISVGASGTMGFWNEAKQQFVFWVDSSGKLLKGIVPAALVSGLAEIGVNQTWRDVTKQRSLNTVYTNSSGKPIFISVTGKEQQQKSYIELWIGAVKASTYYKDANSDAAVSAIVPAGAPYKVTTVGGAIINWAELS